MSQRIIATALFVLCLILGLALKRDPFVVEGHRYPADQAALDHRDSPYSHVSWVVSKDGNYAQLRFFDKVEGGICLHPSWPELQQIGGLEHLIPDSDWTFQPEPGRTWPDGRPHPDMGTVSNTKYTCLYPSAVLLNERLLRQADDDPRQASPNILVVGLGSGIGISVYAHHFPQASITVVDIDQAVIDMVLDHYPLFRWLQQQTLPDGRPRLKVATGDARQYITYPEMRQDDGMQYDIVVLDAYTSGSTIPSHLMTREFYAAIDTIMPEDGIILSNIISSYEAEKRFVIGGAIKAMQAAGLTEVWNLPVVYPQEYPPLQVDQARNNVVLASRQPLSPRQRPAAWRRLRNYTLYPELDARRYESELLYIREHRKPTTKPEQFSAGIKLEAGELQDRVRRTAHDQADQQWKENLQVLRKDSRKPFVTVRDDETTVLLDDPQLIDQVRQAVAQAYGKRLPLGWKGLQGRLELLYEHRDWVLFSRRCWQRAIAAAERSEAGQYRHDGHILSTSTIANAPLYTDAQPNADIYNNR
jgi:hypothetical protein